MINIKSEVVNALKTSRALISLVPANRMHKTYPSEFINLPSISYRQLENRGGFYEDDIELGSEIIFIIDIWGRESTSTIENEVDAVMKSLEFSRTGMQDLFEKDTGIYHTAMIYETKRIDETI